MAEKVPSRLDRATFDRVLQRAAELQAASRDIGEGLSEEEILALGTEVGIPAQHLQQALIEERTHVMLPEPAGVLDHWIGPADIVAQRVVQGAPDAVGAALTKWLSRQEHLVVQRAAGTRITFEQMETFAGAMRRLGAAFDASRGKPYLGKAELVTAVITPLEVGFCHVTLVAALHKARASHVAGGSGLLITGAVAGGAIILAGAPLLVGMLPMLPMMLAGWAIAHTFRGHAHRAQLGLERALDELERRPALPGERPSVSKGSIARGVGQVVRDITQEVRKALDE
jgi:hypothetical protein